MLGQPRFDRLDPDLPPQPVGEVAKEFMKTLVPERWRNGVVEALKQLPFRSEEALGGIEFQAVIRKMQELGFATEEDAAMPEFEESIVEIIRGLASQKNTG